MRPFKRTDLASINKWLKRNSHPPVTLQDLPLKGIIVPGVAAGFLREVEGGIAIIDGLCSNPLVSSGTRNSAMNKIYKNLLSMPYKQFIGFTVDAGALERAKRQGFQPIRHTVLALYKD